MGEPIGVQLLRGNPTFVEARTVNGAPVTLPKPSRRLRLLNTLTLPISGGGTIVTNVALVLIVVPAWFEATSP